MCEDLDKKKNRTRTSSDQSVSTVRTAVRFRLNTKKKSCLYNHTVFFCYKKKNNLKVMTGTVCKYVATAVPGPRVGKSRSKINGQKVLRSIFELNK